MGRYPPFYHEEPMETYRKILEGKVDFPTHFNKHARDIVRKLLQVRIEQGCLPSRRVFSHFCSCLNNETIVALSAAQLSTKCAVLL